MRTLDLMLFVAHDLISGVSRQDVCVFWDIDIHTLSFFESTAEFARCLEIARNRKRLRVPNLFPEDMRKCGLNTCIW